VTPSQTKHYWALWKKACLTQGWHSHTAAVRDQLRYDAHRAAGVPLSSKDINTTTDFDKIKAHLKHLADDLAATIETDHPDFGHKRRLLNFIRSYQFPLLAVCLAAEDAVRRGLQFEISNLQFSIFNSETYIKPILRNRWRADSIESLSAQRSSHGGIERSSALEKLRMDIARTIQTKRKKLGWTLHQLHAAAHLKCPHPCRECARDPAPAPAIDDNDNPF
jgi:hypothetical protein